MVDTKISALTELTTATASDVLPIVNTAETKRITMTNLAASLAFANVNVASGGKLNLEGAAGDTYILFNSATGQIEFWVNGELKFGV